MVEALERLDAAIDELASVSSAGLSPDEVTAFAVGLQRARARLDALVCSSAAAVGSADVAALEGHRSVASVVAAHTGGNPRVVAGDVRTGSWLDDFAVFRDAFGAGGLSRSHVELLRRVDNSRTRHRLVEAQDHLVEAAAACTWREFGQVLRYWVLAFDPDGPAPEDQVAARFCRIGKASEGSVTGSFRLDPVAGQALLSAIEQQEQRLFRADTEAGTMRSAPQRRADALVEVAVRGAARPDGTIPAPLVHLVLSEQVAEALLTGDEAALDAESIDRRCELLDGTPLHPRTAAAVTARAAFRRQVLTGDSITVDLGPRIRVFPPALKQALLVAARGRCAITGCDAPVGWLQADHVHPHARHGPTALWNGQILCDPHNKTKRDTVQDDPP